MSAVFFSFFVVCFFFCLFSFYTVETQIRKKDASTSSAWFGRRANQLREETELWTIKNRWRNCESVGSGERERKRRVGSGVWTDGSVELVSS